MQGVDIGLFEFDWDLTWAAFLMNRHGHIYARYGSRSGEDADRLLSVRGLIRVMERALEAHKTQADTKPPARTPRFPESFRTLPDNLRGGKQCLHCHQVWEYERRDRGAAFVNEAATRVYPLAGNIGMTLDPNRGSVVASVDSKGAAAGAGLREGDEVLAVNDVAVQSEADLSWALHVSKDSDPIRVRFLRGTEQRDVRIVPKGDWKQRDISWRGSMWGLRPIPGFGGKMLAGDELRSTGSLWAIRVGYIVDWGDMAHAGRAVKQAGLRTGDVVVSCNGRNDFATERAFQAWFRLTIKPGQDVQFGIQRGGKTVTISMKAQP